VPWTPAGASESCTTTSAGVDDGHVVAAELCEDGVVGGASVMTPLTSLSGRTVKGEAAPIFSVLART
jgi:hypothetical protein